MMDGSRRSILGMIGAAPFAAKAIGGEVGAAIASVGNANAAQNSIGMGVATQAGSLGKPWTKEMDFLDGVRRRQREKQEWQQRLRMSIGGVDPDIQALRSTSASFKCAKQFERDMQTQDLLEQIQKALWG